MSVFRIEIKLEDEEAEVFIFDTDMHKEPVNAFWTFLGNIKSWLSLTSFQKVFGDPDDQSEK